MTILQIFTKITISISKMSIISFNIIQNLFHFWYCEYPIFISIFYSLNRDTNLYKEQQGVFKFIIRETTEFHAFLQMYREIQYCPQLNSIIFISLKNEIGYEIILNHVRSHSYRTYTLQCTDCP